MTKRAPLILLFTLIICSLNAQESLRYGIDAQRDSIAFARYRNRMDSIRQERPTVALVLSGGGAKGAAHISVIRHLERAGIPIDLVLGTSIGGLVGGLYSCGYNGEELEIIIRSLEWDNLLYDINPRRYVALAQKDYDRQYELSIPFGTYRWDFHRPETSRRSLLREGLVEGRNIEDLFTSLLVGYGDDIDFLSLPIPFACVASDMISAKPKVWHSGSLVEALRSTMSIPGFFTPVKTHNMVLMDGGMINNYPAEIAKQMGADIIIGVDISSPSLEATQMRNMLDIVIQTNDVLGRESYEAGLAVTDIYIQPQLSDFTLLSFDKESIDSILQRGKQAVEAVADKIDSLKIRLNNPDIHNSHDPFIRKAFNLRRSSIKVDSIIFQGIDDKEVQYLRHMLHIESNGLRSFHVVELEEAISTIMGTKAFEKVTYQILGDGEPYTLLFKCFRAPVNQLGASIRLDTRDHTSLLFHYGINTHQLTGSRLDFNLRIGFDTRFSAGYTLSSGRGLDFASTLSFQSVQNGDFNTATNSFSIDYTMSRAEAHIAFLPWRRMSLQLGFMIDYLYITSIRADFYMLVNRMETIDKTNFFPSPYLTLRHDTFDDPYFPTEGTIYQLCYNLYFKGLLHESPLTHAGQFNLRSARSLGRFTLLPHFDVRYISYDIYPYVNMLSISDANRTRDHHITFVGISTTYAAMRLVGSLGLDARLRIGKKHYITASGQVLHEAKGVSKLIDKENSKTHLGVALEYAYSSFIGPLRLNVHWSDISKTPGFYISAGMDF